MNLRSYLSLALLSLVSATAVAQPATDTKPSELVTLSEVVVQQGRGAGYVATNAVSATRVNMPLREVPINIQVVTSDFIMDTAAFGNREAISWMAAVDNKSVRGFNTREFLRNGFLRYSDFSPYNIERIEVIKGPSAILDGITSPGGVINVITKKPVENREFVDASVLFGSREQMNSFIDWNSPIGAAAPWGGHYATVRLPVAYEFQKGYTRYGEKELTVVNPSVLLRPFRDTMVELNYESYRLGADRTDSAGGRDLRLNEVPLAVTYSVSPWMNWLGPDASYNEDVQDFYASVEQRVGERLVLSASYNYESRDTFWELMVNQRALIAGGVPTVQRSFAIEDRLIDIDSMRLNAVYGFDLGSTRHRVLLGWQSQKEVQNVPRYQGVIPATTTEFVQNIPVTATNPDLSGPARTSIQFIPQRVQYSETDNSSYFITHHGRFLKNRLVTLAGLYLPQLETLNAQTGSPQTRYRGDRTLPQLGAVWHLNNQVGLYANTSRSMMPNTGARDGFRRTFDPTFGESLEVGSKFALAERLSGAVGVYRIKEKDRIVFDPLAPNDAGPNGSDDGRGANVATGEITSEGVDVDVQYFPTEQWSAILSYAWNDAKVSGDTVLANVGRQVNGTFRHKLTLWNKYTVGSGQLRGLYVGAGFKWRGEKLRSYVSGQPAYENSVLTLDALVGYTLKMPRVRWNVALNVKNLLEDEVVSGFKPGAIEGYYFQTPTQWALSASARF